MFVFVLVCVRAHVCALPVFALTRACVHEHVHAPSGCMGGSQCGGVYVCCLLQKHFYVAVGLYDKSASGKDNELSAALWE